MTRSSHTNPSTPSRHESDYERSDVDVRVIAGAAAVLGVLLVVILFVAAWHFDLLARARTIETQSTSPFADRSPGPPGPRLQVDPAAELAELRRRERALLTEYRWVDKSQGITAIPIDRAIDLLAERESRNRRGGSSNAP